MLKVLFRSAFFEKGVFSMRIILIVAVIVLAAATPALAGCSTNAECPLHRRPMNFTGQTKLVNSHMFGLYRCPSGHEIWFKCD